MKCNELNKYRVAFVDGELDVERNLSILEHLNLCFDCSKKFDNEKEFNSLIDRVVKKDKAPLHLKMGIRESVSIKKSRSNILYRLFFYPKIRIFVAGGVFGLVLVAFMLFFSNYSDDTEKFVFAAEAHYHSYLMGEDSSFDKHGNETSSLLASYYGDKFDLPALFGDDFKLSSREDCDVMGVDATFLVYQRGEDEISLFITKNIDENRGVADNLFRLEKLSIGKYDFYFEIGECGMCSIVVWKTEESIYTIVTRLNKEQIMKNLNVLNV